LCKLRGKSRRAFSSLRLSAKGGPAIQVQRHAKRTAADVAGTIAKAAEDDLHVHNVMDFKSANYVMTLDKTAFSDGILRVGLALNDLIVAQVKKDHH
jgi:hypothetical protein